MKKLLIVLLALGSFSAVSFATIEANGLLASEMFSKEVSENKSHYETLGEMFKNGSKPEASKIAEVFWSGRCFRVDSPFEATNSAFYLQRMETQNVGPSGGDYTSYEAASIWSPLADSNHFDDKSSYEFIKMKFDKVLNSENSLAIKYVGGLSELRLSGKYLIRERSEIVGTVGPRRGEYQVWSRCYYFIPEYGR